MRTSGLNHSMILTSSVPHLRGVGRASEALRRRCARRKRARISRRNCACGVRRLRAERHRPLLVVLVRAGAVAALPDEAARVGARDGVRRHLRLVDEERGAAEVGGARAVEEEAEAARLADEVGRLRLLDLDPAEDGGDGDGGGALDVVVVREVALAVLGEQREGVVRVEVLELQEAARAEELARRAEELADERFLAVVGLVDRRARRRLLGDAVGLGAGVQLVVADRQPRRVALGAVAAGVDDHRDRAARVEAAAHGVQVELAHRDAHPPRAEVAEAEDAAAVGEDDALALGRAVGRLRQHRRRVLGEDRLHVAAVLERDVAAARVERHEPKLLARLAHRRRVRDGQQQRRVGGEQAVVDRRVDGAERAQVGVRPQVVAEQHDALDLDERLGDGGRRARRAEHRLELAQRRVRVPLLDAARRHHRLRQRQHALGVDPEHLRAALRAASGSR